MTKVETKFRGSWLDRTTEDAPLPLVEKFANTDRFQSGHAFCKVCPPWSGPMVLTGRRAMKKTKARGAVVAFELTCKKGHTVWYVDGWKYGINNRMHETYFGRVEPANPLVKRELLRRAEVDAYQEEQSRVWRIRAEERRVQDEINREIARKEREARMVEPAFMKEFDEVV